MGVCHEIHDRSATFLVTDVSTLSQTGGGGYNLDVSLRAFLWKCTFPLIFILWSAPFFWDFLRYHAFPAERPSKVDQVASLEYREKKLIPCALGLQVYDPNIVRDPGVDKLVAAKCVVMLARGTRVQVLRVVPVQNVSDPGATDCREVRVMNGSARGQVVYVSPEWLCDAGATAHACILGK